MTLLVTGASGKLGGLVVEELLARGLGGSLAVSVRQPERAAALRGRGVDVRHGDFDQPETLARAFAGVERLLLISTDGDTATRIRQHRAAVRAAREARVGFIAYTSIAAADTSTISLAEVHRDSEAAIRASGIPFALLRNNWYLENEAGLIAGALAGAPIATSAGQGRVGWAPRADYAAAAASALAGAAQPGATYELSGPLASYDDLAAALGQVIGRHVPVAHIDDAAYGAGLAAAGLPDFLVPLLVGIAGGVRSGALEVQRSDLPALLGRPATPLREALAQLVAGMEVAR